MCKLIAISVVSSIVVGDFFALAAFAKHASFDSVLRLCMSFPSIMNVYDLLDVPFVAIIC